MSRDEESRRQICTGYHSEGGLVKLQGPYAEEGGEEEEEVEEEEEEEEEEKRGSSEYRQ